MNPLFAEQYRVSPAKTQGLAVGLGGMFFGRTARRWLRSRTATPVYAIKPNGDMLYYKHVGEADGSDDWNIQAEKIGSGWNFRQVFAAEGIPQAAKLV